MVWCGGGGGGECGCGCEKRVRVPKVWKIYSTKVVSNLRARNVKGW